MEWFSISVACSPFPHLLAQDADLEWKIRNVSDSLASLSLEDREDGGNVLSAPQRNEMLKFTSRYFYMTLPNKAVHSVRARVITRGNGERRDRAHFVTH